MRLAIIVAPGVDYVGGCGCIGYVRTLVSDRAANGEAWPGEVAVRLPRSVARRMGLDRAGEVPTYRLSELRRGAKPFSPWW